MLRLPLIEVGDPAFLYRLVNGIDLNAASCRQGSSSPSSTGDTEGNRSNSR
jgi:hypothetical protein